MLSVLRYMFLAILASSALASPGKTGGVGKLKANSVDPEYTIRRVGSPSERLVDEMARYGMSAWECELHSGHDAGVVPYLLYAPRAKGRMAKRLPLLLYFGGTGETGQGTEDLERHFHQRTIFDKITSEKFQSEHPCYLFAPLVRNAQDFRCVCSEKPSLQARQIKCAMMALIKSLGKDAVDTNRLYTTGLSFGGCAAFEMVSSYPSLFAATLPVAATESEFMVPSSHKIEVWWIENRMELTPPWKAMYDRFRSKIEENGGEFRFSTFPSNRHNAWFAAWSEPEAWNWLFSKTCDGRGIERTGGQGRKPAVAVVDLSLAECTSSAEPIDQSHTAKCGADNLDGTCFMADGVKAGGWWKVRFGNNVSGRVAVFTGTTKGECRLSQGALEASADDARWERIGSVSKKDGVAHGIVRPKHRFLRLRVTDSKPVKLVVREVKFL